VAQPLGCATDAIRVYAALCDGVGDGGAGAGAGVGDGMSSARRSVRGPTLGDAQLRDDLRMRGRRVHRDGRERGHGRGLAQWTTMIVKPDEIVSSDARCPGTTRVPPGRGALLHNEARSSRTGRATPQRDALLQNEARYSTTGRVAPQWGALPHNGSRSSTTGRATPQRLALFHNGARCSTTARVTPQRRASAHNASAPTKKDIRWRKTARGEEKGGASKKDSACFESP